MTELLSVSNDTRLSPLLGKDGCTSSAVVHNDHLKHERQDSVFEISDRCSGDKIHS
jgi:hypothetical protein